MRISFNPNQLFDLAGKPLVSGRVSFYMKDTDILANTYYRDGDAFIEGQNPVVLDNAGSFVNTIFLDVAIYDIVVEKYTDGVYHQIDNFEFGFEMPDVTNDTVVQDIEGLLNANPQLGSVTVVGYDSNVSCGPRTYIWDSQCTDAADGGAIVESNSSENGRWILLSDLREMPCKYYGIAPGYESNISAFLTYPQLVGTYGIWLPPVPRFLSGVYASSGTFSADKTISFDPYTRFPNASFVCRNIECCTRANYIADFQFTNQSYAESSWFRTARAFWTCGAAELHQSTTNYFESADIGNVGLEIANVHVSGNPIEMTGTGQMTFTNCRFDDRTLSTNWYISMVGEFFADKWFADGNWDFGAYPHHQHVPATSNSVVMADFADGNVYVLWAAAYGITALDLQGRTVGTIESNMPFNAIANGQIAEAHFVNDISLHGITVYGLYMENYNANLTANDSTIVLKDSHCAGIALSKCHFVNQYGIDSAATAFTAVDSSVDLSAGLITRSAANDRTESTGTHLTRCVVSGGAIDDNGIELNGCTVSNTLVRVIPSGAAGNISCVFRNNVFDGTSQVQFVTSLDGVSDPLCYECQVTHIEFSGNTFNTVQMGIKMPFWAEDGAHRYLNGVTSFVDGQYDVNQVGDYYPIPYYYYNNIGNCPRQFGAPTGSDLPGALCIIPRWGNSSYSLNFEKDVDPCSVFALPVVVNASKGPIPDPLISNAVYSASAYCVTIPYRAKATFGTGENGGNRADFPLSAYIPVCAYDKSQPNDMFYSLVGAYGESAQFFGVNPIGSQQ